MKKSNVIAFLAAAALTTASMYAGDTEGCHSKAAECEWGTKVACDLGSANLDLTEEQKSQLAALQAECDKEGCTEASCSKMLKGAEAVLSAEQFAKLKGMCEKACAAKAESAEQS